MVPLTLQIFNVSQNIAPRIEITLVFHLMDRGPCLYPLEFLLLTIPLNTRGSYSDQSKEKANVVPYQEVNLKALDIDDCRRLHQQKPTVQWSYIALSSAYIGM